MEVVSTRTSGLQLFEKIQSNTGSITAAWKGAGFQLGSTTAVRFKRQPQSECWSMERGNAKFMIGVLDIASPLITRSLNSV
jgi:hypothetical protein